MKKKIVYFNSDCFTDTDTTVLKHLVKDFDVVWFYLYESIKDSNKLTIEYAKSYGKKYGIDVRVIDPKVRYRSPKNLKFYFKLADEINKINPDMVFHCNRNPYWALAVNFRLKCDKVILGVHDVKAHSYSLSLGRLLDNMTRGLSLRIHKFFITFSTNQQAMLQREYHKDSYMVGMSYKDFGISNKKKQNINQGIKLLFFGSINKYKGLDLFITALEDIRLKGIQNLTLTIAGKGPDWEHCKSLVKTKEMFNLNIRFVDNSEIPDLMSSHHFLVLPYRDATQSGPLATAVAYELPIIAPNFGCFAETYNNKSAILYDKGGLVDALKTVSVITEEQYINMTNECKVVKENNSEEKIAENYIKCFNKVINM